MPPNEENEKPGQNQAQGVPAESGVEQQEPPRVCKICGGPNHHGCGCEAKLDHRRGFPVEAEETELTKAMGLQEAEPETAEQTADQAADQADKANQAAIQESGPQPDQLEPGLKPAPGSQPSRDWFDKKLSDEEHEMANRMYDNFENISVQLYDIINLLKINNNQLSTIISSKGIPKLLTENVELLKLISQEEMAIRATLQKMEAKMNNAKDTNHN